MNPKDLFESNINLVYKVYHDRMKQKSGAELLEEDLIQTGMISLWKACLKFDESRGVKFCTYAYASIYKSMLCLLVRENKKNSSPVSLFSPTMTVDGKESYTHEEVIPCYKYTVNEFELEKVIQDVSSELSKNSQKVIDLIRKGNTQQEIAEQLGMTQSNVSKILKRFRKNLKNTLLSD